MSKAEPVAVVIRGGTSRDASRTAAYLRQLVDEGERPVISVFALFGEEVSLEGVCRAARAPWGQVQVSSAEKLRDAGFELLDERDPDEADCHYHVLFEDDVTESDCLRFFECFSVPVPNPVPAFERKGF